MRYYLTNYTHTEHDQNQVVESYRAFYQYYTAAGKESGVRPFFIYSMPVLPDTESFGFFARNEGISNYRLYSKNDQASPLLRARPGGDGGTEALCTHKPCGG